MFFGGPLMSRAPAEGRRCTRFGSGRRIRDAGCRWSVGDVRQFRGAADHSLSRVGGGVAGLGQLRGPAAGHHHGGDIEQRPPERLRGICLPQVPMDRLLTDLFPRIPGPGPTVVVHPDQRRYPGDQILIVINHPVGVQHRTLRTVGPGPLDQFPALQSEPLDRLPDRVQLLADHGALQELLHSLSA